MSEVFFCSNWLNPRWQNEDIWHYQVEWEWISLSQSFVQNCWIQDGSIQDGCHHKVEWEWMSEVFFCSKWLKPRWQNSRWLTSSSWVRMNEFESDWISLSQSFVQNGWIQDGRIQDGCHHHINQIELVWIRVRVEWECFWVNLKEDNKVSESKMTVAESKMVELQDGCHHQVESEWMSKVSSVQNGWIQDGRIQDGWHPQVRVRMNEFESEFVQNDGTFQDGCHHQVN